MYLNIPKNLACTRFENDKRKILINGETPTFRTLSLLVKQRFPQNSNSGYAGQQINATTVVQQKQTTRISDVDSFILD